ncbi:ABC transporter ATP-binding protein [Pseudoteredinibacter isoporae]|uniref:ABC-2 type transport system ATP-binding protein n=1 Tax=Pseudoteredinibacter isoporae TaxID=570281 RepID=A0A7X0JYA2_9GAMM|nr:ABC transporter ATP-binding protein [Pseudoteredinibacter isoporae]MBB6523780.1 ABC-2 type transport system ATP-binding protein [Pseudoteredinibacter isoporae]NHO89300.1 ABC transporter ATP-binding protein [Pseudoteredinibacter isoporae]NIB22407.1 ABC transporter ATP-binding protein [Pseudoteredinibacter isoporae]
MSLLECKNLSKRFGQFEALKPTNLTLEKGSPIALIGPNGAGKTTFFSLLCNYIQASSGEIRILGEPIDSRSIQGRLGSLPQDAQLDRELNIVQQLSFLARLQGFSKAAATQEAERVLTLVDLGDSLTKKPQELSHGMNKRVLFAQALIGNPELVLLDEPTAGVDPNNARMIRNIIEQQSQQQTFIISSHNIAELEKLCQRVLYIEQGILREHQSQEQSTGNRAIIELELCSDQAQLVQDQLHKLAAFQSASSRNPRQLSIRYDAFENTFDQKLLALLAQQGIEYQQLKKGLSLEEQLFAEKN